MSINIADALEGLAERLRTIPSLPTVYAFVPDQIVTPCAVIALGDENTYDDDFTGAMVLQVKVQCLVSRSSSTGGQRQLYAWAAYDGEDSVREAIADDRTLGATCDFATVEGFSGPASYDYGEGVLGIEFTVEVIG
jgi:hypothetical protein